MGYLAMSDGKPGLILGMSGEINEWADIPISHC